MTEAQLEQAFVLRMRGKTFKQIADKMQPLTARQVSAAIKAYLAILEEDFIAAAEDIDVENYGGTDD